MQNMRTAIVGFFEVYPPKSGSSVVIYDFFCSWPNLNKCLFQLSHSIIKKKKITNIKLIKNKPLFKIIILPIIIYKIFKCLKSSKRKILILEGASWIFYSYSVIFIIKILIPDIFIIYRSHSIEYEIRKKNSSFFTSLITKYFEQKVYRISNIVTSVSNLEKQKAKKYYSVETRLFPNSIRIADLKKLKEKKIKYLPKKYILFCGSYEYPPNKVAINYIIKKILPVINKKDNVVLVLTGSPSNINFNNKNVIHLSFVNRSELKFLYRNAICLVAPLFEGYGTRIKIIESLVLGSNIVTTHKGIEGIHFEKNKKIIVTDNLKKMIESIYYFNKSYKKLYKNNPSTYKNYSMEVNALNLYRNI